MFLYYELGSNNVVQVCSQEAKYLRSGEQKPRLRAKNDMTNYLEACYI